jgi:AcrR family transcriptional regulator
MARTSKQASPSRARDRARHEAEILEAAERLFARKGYAAATMSDIAGEAGFAIGTLYNLFGSKDAIFDRLLELHCNTIAREMAVAMAEVGTPREKLEASTQARAAYLAAHRDFFLLYVNEIPGAQVAVPVGRESVSIAVRDQLSRLETVFQEIGPAVLDPTTRALLFFGATRAYIIERVLRAQRPPKPKEITAVVQALLEGMGGRT